MGKVRSWTNCGRSSAKELGGIVMTINMAIMRWREGRDLSKDICWKNIKKSVCPYPSVSCSAIDFLWTVTLSRSLFIIIPHKLSAVESYEEIQEAGNIELRLQFYPVGPEIYCITYRKLRKSLF